MRYLKTWVPVFLLSFALVLPSTAQRKKITETVDFSASGRVQVDTYKGSIDVTTWDRNEVEIEAIVEADGNGALVAFTEVHIRQSGNRLRIESDYSKAKKEGQKLRNWGKNNMSLPFVHYKIKMPKTADLIIEDYKSEITIESLVADLDLETYKGEARIYGVTGDLRIDTYKGDVKITELAGSLEADTYKGNITAEFAEFSGNSSIDTYRGDVRLRLPRDAGFDLNANLGNKGDLDTNFGLSDVSIEKNKYRGTVGGGGPNLEVDTHRGRIEVSSSR
ncbi:MAG: DUF4097 domain-containing protein [Rhodothermales bacterium]